MPKKPKLATPDWILKGGKKPKEKKLMKKFVIKFCPRCESENISVVIGENGRWECHKCKWKGEDVREKEVSEDEFMKMGEEK